MESLFFSMKMLVASVLILFVLQIKVGNTTAESHIENWVYESAAAQTLNTVARGAVRASIDGYNSLSRFFNKDSAHTTVKSAH